MDTIFNHKSIRKYKTDTIDDKILEKILLAGTRASNSGNMQVYSMVVTKDENIRKQLHGAHFGQNMVLEAPVHITFCADINRFNKWCEQGNAQPVYDNFLWLYNATIDAVLASQNVCIEAESHGLGVCYLGTTTYMADKIIEILELPKGVIPVTSIVVGYPDESPELTDRLPLNGVVHFEKYNNYSSDSIKDIYAEKENLPSTKKLIAENETENLAQIFTDKRYKKDDNIHFSKSFLETLKKQGFMNQ
ncbi:MAG: nitroreductase family protein [Salinivirgaceae bacterium]|jgi:FMN reductase (NADPH)|nr:nitroreductase family protein [Salinivirgaceae bacterium]